jgi:hypothetical protein
MDAKTAARIESLTHSPAWDDLAGVLQEAEDKFWKRHIADLKAGDAIDQRELDRALGKLDGIRAVLRAPATAATIMLRESAKEKS